MARVVMKQERAMAHRRMFSLDVVDTDAFLEMPTSSQNLYFHLCMRADDDGFVSGPKKIMRTVNATADDMRVLMTKYFVIPFDSGVCVIRHWRLQNYIQSDRYHKTIYLEEKKKLIEKDGVYSLDTECIQPVSKTLPQVRLELGKDSLDREAPADAAAQFEVTEIYEPEDPPLDTPSPPKRGPVLRRVYGSERNVLLTDDQYAHLVADLGEPLALQCIEELSTAKAMKGYKYKRDDLAIRKWVVDAVKGKHADPAQGEIRESGVDPKMLELVRRHREELEAQNA